MEKTYKQVPFDIELAKKIQSGEIEGRIVTQDNEPVRIVCFDKKSTNKREKYQVVALVETNGHECLIICGENGLCWDAENDCNRSLHIELPEEAPKFKPFDKVLVRHSINGIDAKWKPQLFSMVTNDPLCKEKVLYETIDGYQYDQCIPYEGNEYLAQ